MQHPDGLLTYSKSLGYRIQAHAIEVPQSTINLQHSWCLALEFMAIRQGSHSQVVYCVIPHNKHDSWSKIRIRLAIPAGQPANRAVNLALHHLKSRLAPTAFILWARKKLLKLFPGYENQKEWQLYLKNLITEWSPDTEEGRRHLAQTLRLGDFNAEAFPIKSAIQ